MDVAAMKELLKREYGICSEKEFYRAVSEMKGVDIGIFTMPFKRNRGDNEKENKTKTKIVCC